MKAFNNIFTNDEIKNIKEYKYDKEDKSISYKLFLKRYYLYLSEFIPISISPNFITLIGFLIEIASFSISFTFSKGISQRVPRWVCFMNGITAHVYQVLSNIDFCQAQRTNKVSPLLHFFERSINSVVSVIEIMKLIVSYNFGSHIDTYILALLMSCCFFFTTWEEYNTRSIKFDVINGPNEGLLILTAGHFFSGIRPDMIEIAYHSNSQIAYLPAVGFSMLFSAIRVFRSNFPDIRKIFRSIVSLLPLIITITISFGSMLQYQDPLWTPYFTLASCFAIQYQGQMNFVAILTQRPPQSMLFALSVMIIWILMLVPVFLPFLNEEEIYWAAITAFILLATFIFDSVVIKGIEAALSARLFGNEEEAKSDEVSPEIHMDGKSGPLYLFQNINDEAQDEQT